MKFMYIKLIMKPSKNIPMKLDGLNGLGLGFLKGIMKNCNALIVFSMPCQRMECTPLYLECDCKM